MSLIPLNSLFEDELFDRFLAPKLTTNAGFFSPKVQIKENDKKFIVTAEIPGVKKEDIHIHLESGVLTLEAETKEEKTDEEDGKIVKQERRYGKYTRSFNVGKNIQESDISADYTDGILSLTFPKAEPKSPERKKIKIG